MSHKVAVHVKSFIQAVFPSGNFSVKNDGLHSVSLLVFFTWSLTKVMDKQNNEFIIYGMWVHKK